MSTGHRLACRAVVYGAVSVQVPGESRLAPEVVQKGLPTLLALPAVSLVINNGGAFTAGPIRVGTGAATGNVMTVNGSSAIVTNVSADHFGEYGVESLSDLADVKLVVTRAIGPSGLAVLNADDPELMARAGSQW